MPLSAIEFAQQNRDRFLDELKELLRIPSISTQPRHKQDVQRAAEFVAEKLKAAGMEHVELIPTQGHPLVYADWLHAPGKPTVICYGHYDVQPPDPLKEWKTPPFEPTVRDNNIYARGAVDDKGQMYMHIKAFEALMAEGKLPLNVKVLIEGEEEVGGESISKYVRENPERLKADFALISDTEMFAPDLPSICVGLRGMVYVELEAVGAKVDLHSGMYGGVAPNPLFALCEVIAKMKDEKGKILIPHFYDKVKKASETELKDWSRLPLNEEEYRENEVGSPELVGEPGFSILERLWARPTLEVHGMPGGYVDPGAKTVIPARASAKISMRLVPDMDPNETFRQFSDFVKANTPAGIQFTIQQYSMGEPTVIRTDNKYVNDAMEALREVFHKDTVFIRSGGSVPIVSDFENHLHIPSVMMGFGLPDDNLHAPNEKFHIPNFYRGIESIIRFLKRVGA